MKSFKADFLISPTNHLELFFYCNFPLPKTPECHRGCCVCVCSSSISIPIQLCVDYLFITIHGLEQWRQKNNINKYKNQPRRLNTISVMYEPETRIVILILIRIPNKQQLVAETFGPNLYFHNLSKWKTIEPTAMRRLGKKYGLIYSGSFDVCTGPFRKTSTKKSIPVSCTTSSSSHLINFSSQIFQRRQEKRETKSWAKKKLKPSENGFWFPKNDPLMMAQKACFEWKMYVNY